VRFAGEISRRQFVATAATAAGGVLLPSAVFSSPLSKVSLSTSFPRKRESTRLGSPLTRGRRRLLLSSPWVGRRPMTTRNDSSGKVRPSIKLGDYPNDQKRRQGAKKDVKIEGTNSTSPLESIKVSKNELKTNWFLSAKKANQSQNSGP
jgi:hypothetical protein